MFFNGRRQEVRINYFEKKFMGGIQELELVGSSFSLVADKDSFVTNREEIFLLLTAPCFCDK